MDQKTAYLRSLFVNEDKVLQSIPQGLQEQGMPLISVPSDVGYLLHWFAQLTEARSILEIGSLGGYSTIWLGRALPKEGQLITVELDEDHANFAKENVKKAGLDQVRFEIGDAKEVMHRLWKDGYRFDLVFIDADKVSYPTYLEKAIELTVDQGLILMDNLFLGGRVWDEEDENPSATAIRQVHQQLADDPRLQSYILPVGDGLGVSYVHAKTNP